MTFWVEKTGNFLHFKEDNLDFCYFNTMHNEVILRRLAKVCNIDGDNNIQASKLINKVMSGINTVVDTGDT